VGGAGGAVGSKVRVHQTLDHFHGDGWEVVLSRRGDPLTQVLGLVRADGVYGGQDHLSGGGAPVARDQRAVVGCRGLARWWADSSLVTLDVVF